MDVDLPEHADNDDLGTSSKKTESENLEEMPEKVELPVVAHSEQNSVHVGLCDEMLNHLANSKVAFFKSQQVGDPELNFEEKREIAVSVLNKSPSQFLARFGQHILERHLDYFTDKATKTECYEVDFHVGQLRRFHCKAKNQVDIKNRRFEALKKLVDEGSYFSEKEMMKRNPLLYEQLVGQYLTKKEREAREKEIRAESERSYVCHLMQRIEEHEMNLLKKRQQDDEDGAVEEVDTSDEEEEDNEKNYKMQEVIDDDDDDDDDDYSDDEDGDNEDIKDITESGTSEEPDGVRRRLMARDRRRLAAKERTLLREEFITNMYQCFLEGKDEDFDYSEVDRNPEFECLAVRTQDEEEKYFDSETPELVSSKQCSAGEEEEEEEEEDELDKFMKNLKPETTASELADDMKQL